MGKWRRHSREFKQQAVERMKRCENVEELARDLGIERKLLYSWKYQFEGRPEPKHANYLGRAAPQTAETRLRAENQALKLTLTVERMCQLAAVSRAGYYRHLAQHQPDQEDMEVRAAIQEIALAHQRRYGYRRITAELHRRGMQVNHKRVARLMREDNLLSLRYRHYIVTTDSQHNLEVYLNLASRMQLTAINQLWIADITYIRLQREFVYLAAILDAFSRRVIGWALDRTLAARLPLAALAQAIAQRQPPPGLVHHSDRGVQYASHDYIGLLEAHSMTPSMSRPANPYDNATCESFMKTLKHEEIYCRDYRDIDDLRRHVEEFLDRYYNHQRLHSALGYRTPAEFEQQCLTNGADAAVAAPRMSFFRHGKSIAPMPIQSLSGEPLTGSPAHRSDEFPAGYSSVSCSPAELTSASPAEPQSVLETT
jgi:transposase InsO family protein